MGLPLFIISFILVGVSTPIGFLMVILKSLLKMSLSPMKGYWLDMAISLDQFGNVCMGPLFDMILIHKDAEDKFGNPDETISSVLGKNNLNSSLTYLGRALDNLLNNLEEDHSLKSIEEDE